jgi:hypothetical protein
MVGTSGMIFEWFMLELPFMTESDFWKSVFTAPLVMMIIRILIIAWAPSLVYFYHHLWLMLRLHSN